MSAVHTIGSETLLQFIARQGGAANTSNIANRFGWEMREAKRRLEAAVQAGELVKIPAHSFERGSVCSWELPPETLTVVDQ